MSREPLFRRKTAISYKTEEKTVMRGYNLSDKPEGVESYKMRLLTEDAAAVIAAEGREKAIVVGHDWGGMVSWNLAMRRPELVEKLVILNLPHPMGLARELATNPEQQENSAYARRFQQPDAHKALEAEKLARWVRDPEARKHYVEAFERSSFEAMLAYYKIAGTIAASEKAATSRV